MRGQQANIPQASDRDKPNDLLNYEWSKGYLSKSNPKNGEEEYKIHDKEAFR